MTSIQMVSIPAGSFMMGSPENEKNRYSDEGPQHEVTLQGFLMSQTPITQKQWREVAALPMIARELDPEPSHFKGDDRPVERVNWYDAMEFCQRLSQHTGRHYTLPSEAQWEYACRAGTTTPFYFGGTITTELANYDGSFTYDNGPKGEYRRQTTPVGMFPANAWGLHDMHGNVWEWCLDDWRRNYENAPTDGSAWLEADSLGKSCVAAPGSTILSTAARPSATSVSPPLPSDTSASASLQGADSLGKCCVAVAGTASRCAAARPSAATPTPPMPTTASGSASLQGADSLGKYCVGEPGSSNRCHADRPPAATPTPPLPTTTSASASLQESDSPGKSCVGDPGLTAQRSVVQPIGSTCRAPFMPNTTLGSASSQEASSLGKPCVAVPGAAPRRAAARPTASAAAPPLPNTTLGSASSQEASSLGKCCVAVPGSTPPGAAARPAASTATPPMPATASASALSQEDDDFLLLKVLRGGSWDYGTAGDCRSACRDYDHPAYAGNYIGFRVCCLPRGRFS